MECFEKINFPLFGIVFEKSGGADQYLSRAFCKEGKMQQYLNVMFM
jgi:hypothetical protein